MTMAAISLRRPRSGKTIKSQALLPAAKLSGYCTAQEKAAAVTNEQISKMPFLYVDIVARLIRGPGRADCRKPPTIPRKIGIGIGDSPPPRSKPVGEFPLR